MNRTIPQRLVPKLWETLPNYTRQQFFADLIAGVTVGLVALPLAMAFAISSGVTPKLASTRRSSLASSFRRSVVRAARSPGRPVRSSSSWLAS